MRIGVPKEVKVHEYRVGLIPASAREVVAHGHEVLVETGAGERMGVSDDDYRRAGANIARDAAEVFERAELDREGEGAPASGARDAAPRDRRCSPTCIWRPIPAQAKDLMNSGVTAIAYETVTGAQRRPAAALADERGRRPHVDPGRRALPRDGAGRPRHAARRHGRCRAGKRRGDRRRCRRRQRGAHEHRARGGGHLHRHQHRAALCARSAVRRIAEHHLLHAPGDRGLRARKPTS